MKIKSPNNIPKKIIKNEIWVLKTGLRFEIPSKLLEIADPTLISIYISRKTKTEKNRKTDDQHSTWNQNPVKTERESRSYTNLKMLRPILTGNAIIWKYFNICSPLLFAWISIFTFRFCSDTSANFYRNRNEFDFRLRFLIQDTPLLKLIFYICLDNVRLVFTLRPISTIDSCCMRAAVWHDKQH